MNTNSSTRVRFAPSPTGYLHIGGARTALYNYLFAKKNDGSMVLRIEDTDRNRYVEDSEQQLMKDLKWLGMNWDEGPDVGGIHSPYTQSERTKLHRSHAEQLVNTDKAYYCFCDKARLQSIRSKHKGYDGHCREYDIDTAQERVRSGEDHTIRFRSPKQGTTTVDDLIRKNITVKNEQLEDFVLFKADGFPVYHLAAMVDDHLMGITHVIRGEEWLSSIAKHALIIRAFGWSEPIWCHLSVLTQPGGKGKMSKRDIKTDAQDDNHSIFIHDLRSRGYHPEAIINWMVLMGWSLDDKQEDFKLADLEAVFNLERINPSPAAVNFGKLDHFQGKYIRQMSDNEVAANIQPFLLKSGITPDKEMLLKLVPLIKNRITTFEDSVEWLSFFFTKEFVLSPSEFTNKKSTKEETLVILQEVKLTLEQLSTYEHENIESELRILADKMNLKLGQLLNPVRLAISGQKVSPPLFETLELLGEYLVNSRIEKAIKLLEDTN